MALQHDPQGFLTGNPADIGNRAVDLAETIRQDVKAIRDALLSNSFGIKAASKRQQQAARLSTHMATATPQPRDAKGRYMAFPKAETQQARRKGGSLFQAAASPATAASEPEARDRKGRYSQGDSGSMGSERRDKEFSTGIGDAIASRLRTIKDMGGDMGEADPAVKAMQEVAEPMSRGWALLAGDKGENRKEGWFRRIWGELKLTRKDDSTFNKEQKKLLKAIEKKSGAGVFIGGQEDGGGIMGWLKTVLGIGGTFTLGGWLAKLFGGPTVEGGFFKNLGKKVPWLGVLFEGFGLATGLIADELNPDLTAKERTNRRWKRGGDFVGKIGGMVLGAKLGAAIGTAILPGFGTAIGGFLGGVGGYLLGDKFGEKVGEWTQSLMDADIPGMMGRKWDELIAWVRDKLGLSPKQEWGAPWKNSDSNQPAPPKGAFPDLSPTSKKGGPVDDESKRYWRLMEPSIRDAVPDEKATWWDKKMRRNRSARIETARVRLGKMENPPANYAEYLDAMEAHYKKADAMPEEAVPRKGGGKPSGHGLKPDVVALTEKIGEEEGVDPKLIQAVIGQESGGHPNALSNKNAGGLMQLIPATAKRFGVKDRFDPEQSVRGGVKYLKWLLDKYDGNTELALAGYNAGEGAVDDYLNGTNKTGKNPRGLKTGGIPPWEETQAYVPAIMDKYGRLKSQTGGAEKPETPPSSPTISIPTLSDKSKSGGPVDASAVNEILNAIGDAEPGDKARQINNARQRFSKMENAPENYDEYLNAEQEFYKRLDAPPPAPSPIIKPMPPADALPPWASPVNPATAPYYNAPPPVPSLPAAPPPPTPAEAPSVPTRLGGDKERTVSVTMPPSEAGQDLPDRGIAHIVTGGYARV